MIEFLQPYIDEFIIGIIALILGYFGKGAIQKKMDNADLTAKIQAVYKDLVQDADKQMDLLRQEINILKNREILREDQWQKKIEEMETSWQKKIEEVEKSWQTKYSRLQTKYNALLKDFENYKAKHK